MKPRIFFVQASSFLIFISVALFFAGGGHGSYVPYVIFWSFFSFPFLLISEPTGLVFWIPPLLHTILIGVFVVGIMNNKSRQKYFLGIIVTHLVGVVIGFKIYKSSTFFPQFASTAYLPGAVAVAIDACYWVCLYKSSKSIVLGAK